jgi:hypothetical protein
LVIERWDALPELVRAGIVAMVEAAAAKRTRLGKGKSGPWHDASKQK